MLAHRIRFRLGPVYRSMGVGASERNEEGNVSYFRFMRCVCRKDRGVGGHEEARGS